MDEQKEKLEAMEREKERKIRHYMQLQDKADAVNEEIYHVCCDVETLNVQINALQAEMKKAAQAALKANASGKPGNGNGNGNGHKPTNGASH